MKKILICLIIVISLSSCNPCDPYEIRRNLITETNKDFFLEQQRTDTYINEKGENIKIVFSQGKTTLEKISDDHDCGYYTYERIEQEFSFNNYLGRITIGNGAMNIDLSDYVVVNNNSVYGNQISELSELETDVNIAGFTFTNVLKLDQENTIDHAIWDIETIIYSKERGIEFILFRNQTWLKLTNN